MKVKIAVQIMLDAIYTSISLLFAPQWRYSIISNSMY